jgi:hypothetical protein
MQAKVASASFGIAHLVPIFQDKQPRTTDNNMGRPPFSTAWRNAINNGKQ